MRGLADFGRGIKAGLITGAIYLAISLILVFTLADYQYALGFWDAAGLAVLPLGGPIVRGIIFGAVFATLHSSLPGKTSIEKGVVFSLFLWILTIIEVTYTNLSWPWQTAGALDIGTYYGGTINLSSVSLTLISIMSALVFGVLTGFFWNRFRGKESTEEEKSRAILLVSFILGAITWVVIGGTYIRFMVIIGVPFIRVLFFSWYTILRTLVLFVGLLGWIFALTAWRKTGRGESGFRWSLAGGVIMALTGFMLVPGALAIMGGVFGQRKAARKPGTTEAVIRDKVVSEQKTRTSMKRNLILLIIGAVMLTIIIVRFTIPTPTGTYTPVTLDQYSSTVISRYGLSLTISLNSTTYHPGEQISVNVEEKNILPTQNEVRAADRWPVHGLTLTPCGRLYYPFGISILQGYYDSENVTGVTPLELFDPNVVYTCPAIVAAVSYDFQPWSASAAIYTSYELMPWSVNMTTRVTSQGFWTGSYPNATFSNFTPGIYTVVAGDEWGSLVVLHFTIS